jgi:hypothetical protein
LPAHSLAFHFSSLLSSFCSCTIPQKDVDYLYVDLKHLTHDTPDTTSDLVFGQLRFFGSMLLSSLSHFFSFDHKGGEAHSRRKGGEEE